MSPLGKHAGEIGAKQTLGQVGDTLMTSKGVKGENMKRDDGLEYIFYDDTIFDEHTQSKKTIKLAPAICFNKQVKKYYLNTTMFSSEQQAREEENTNAFYKVVKWPAGEMIEVEVEE